MIPSRWTRFKRWICMRFGHRLRFTHTFAHRDYYVCKRCKVLNTKQVFDRGREDWRATRNRKKSKTENSI